MKIIFYILAGLAGGILGGLGMGGGTLLIPILVLLLGVPQQTAQFINLASFVPMSLVALIIHIKNGFVAFNKLCIVLIPALIFAGLGAFVGTQTDSALLGKLFGGFLVVLGVLSLTVFNSK